MGFVRAIYRLFLLFLAVVIGLPVYTLLIAGAMIFGPRARCAMVMALKPTLYGFMTWSFGVRLTIAGKRDPDALLFVSNHCSYLDILIASAVIGGIFISRHDVKDWPVIGVFARIEGTVFLDRASLRSASESAERMLFRTQQGARMILFPEGGITPGPEVGQFRPFLLRAVVAEHLSVQPFTLHYSHIDNDPVTAETQHIVLWDDPSAPLPSHSWRILKLPKIHVRVTFHPTVKPPSSQDKESVRAFAEELRQVVAAGIG
jgi:1-acyl-sn-glycerol-3-phosphate acyltransferase